MYLTGFAPNALVVLEPKAAGAAPNADVCCWVLLLPNGVAGRVEEGEARRRQQGRARDQTNWSARGGEGRQATAAAWHPLRLDKPLPILPFKTQRGHSNNLIRSLFCRVHGFCKQRLQIQQSYT